ncbi:MAG: hypothetical protein QGH60_13175 [Phycisphaerae bacterium]|jgi:hypothetical protein|nr:hypothetical protein [Phycisphaerae bacterium]
MNRTDNSDIANISFGGGEVEFVTDSPYVALLSASVLDSLADELGPLCARRCPDLKGVLGEFINTTAYGQIGLFEIPIFLPGRYRLDVSFVQKVASRPPGSFLVDGGALLAVDASKISLLARRLDWDIYNELLASPPDDSSVQREVVESMGGPYFAIVTSDADLDLEFDGDGRYVLRPGALSYVD